MSDAFVPAAIALGVLWLPYAVVVWWRLRFDRNLRQEDTADASRWIDGMELSTPAGRLPAAALRWLLRHGAWEFTCALNGLLWPVEALTRHRRKA